MVRKAAGILPSSPVYPLVQGHMAGLCRRADALASDTAADAIGDATLELVRAMISSAGQDDPRSGTVMNETLYTRIVAFIQQNLTDPGLSPERIAREHHISVRQLYKLWTHNDLSLSEWIMTERLEGARRTLAAHHVHHHRHDRPPLGFHRLDPLQPPLRRSLRPVPPRMAPPQHRLSRVGPSLLTAGTGR